MTSYDIITASNIMCGTQQIERLYIGDDLLWSSERLPEGYTRLQYIYNPSTAYIDLNIRLYEVFNTNYDIAIKFDIDPGLANQVAIWSCQDSDNQPWPGTFIRIGKDDTVVGRYIGGSNRDNTIGVADTLMELPVLIPPNKNVKNIFNNGGTHLYGSALFCAFVGGINNPDRHCKAKLYYFKLFVNGRLVRNMIPCLNDNNVVGLYDSVNKVFYSSPNGVAFTAGPTV